MEYTKTRKNATKNKLRKILEKRRKQWKRGMNSLHRFIYNCETVHLSGPKTLSIVMIKPLEEGKKKRYRN